MRYCHKTVSVIVGRGITDYRSVKMFATPAEVTDVAIFREY